MKRVILTLALVTVAAAAVIHAQQKPQPFVPVSEEMLLKPSPDDWLMYSRTYDAQRFSPLNQITTRNVGQLREVFKKELPAGVAGKHPHRLSRRDVRDAPRQRGAGAGRGDGCGDLGTQEGNGCEQGQDDLHLRRHGLQQHAPMASSRRSTRERASCAGKRSRRVG